jgi:hypothetical protein
MSLTTCKECGGKISSEAAACPACGAKPPKPTSRFTWVAGAIALFVVYQCTSGMQAAEQARTDSTSREASRVAALTPEQRRAEDESRALIAAAKLKEEATFQRAVRVTQALKAGMKNPAAFELVALGLTDTGTLCYEYRSTNSFNAVVPGYAVVLADGTTSSSDAKGGTAAWNKHCAKKGLQDLLHVRRAM